MANASLKNIENIWPSVSNILSVPRNKKDYLNLCNKLDELIDEVGNNYKHSLASLMETIGLLIEKYEEEHFSHENIKGIEVLKHLSEISNGKRELNIRQIKLLSERHTNILLWENGFR